MSSPWSRDQRWVLAFNGEVYNHVKLRHRLEAGGVAFHGGSDTEVLLEAVAAWGQEKAHVKSNGMFALALWHRAERRLIDAPNSLPRPARRSQ